LGVNAISSDAVLSKVSQNSGQGLRPIQIWVPDVRAPAFKAQAHRQSLAVATSLQANEDQSFIDAVSDLRLDKGLE
jgi:hypothetical protein